MQKRKVIRIAVGGTIAAQTDADWERLSTLAEPRLTEMAENYRALGYEVEIRELQRTQDSGCTSCFDAGEAMGRAYGTLYIRRKPAPAADDDLLQ